MAYILPIASDITLGGVKIGSGLTITEGGVLDTDLSAVQEKLDSIATNIEEGKQYIADSLTNKGKPSTSDETLKSYSEKIDSLNTSQLGIAKISPYTQEIFRCVDLNLSGDTYKEEVKIN